MDINDLINKKVKHVKLGKGVIIDAHGNVIVVRFDNNKESKFSYPSAFRNFLTMDNAASRKKVEADLEQWLIDSGTLEKEQLQKKTANTQKEIDKRNLIRQKQRYERAKADAERNRYFAGLDTGSNGNMYVAERSYIHNKDRNSTNEE